MADRVQPPRFSLYADLVGKTAAIQCESFDGSTRNQTIDLGPATTKETIKEDGGLQSSLAFSRLQPAKRPRIGVSKPRTKNNARKVEGLALDHEAARVVNNESSKPRIATSSCHADWSEYQNETYNSHSIIPDRSEHVSVKKKRQKKTHLNDPCAPEFQSWDDIYDPARPNIYMQYARSDEKYVEKEEWKASLCSPPQGPTLSLPELRCSSEAVTYHNYDRPSSLDAMQRQSHDGSLLRSPPARSSAADSVLDQTFNLDKPRVVWDHNFTAGNLPHMMNDCEASASHQMVSSMHKNLSNREEEAIVALVPARTHDHCTQPTNISSQVLSPEDDRRILSNEPGSLTAQPISGSTRPGQKNFARRLMEKYGWAKGHGLGANNSGIVKPLAVKIDNKKGATEGSKISGTKHAAKGVIVDRNIRHQATDNQSSKYGNVSVVIVMHNMLEGLNVDDDISRRDGGLLQEIGDECNSKYGLAEKVYIHRSSSDAFLVFVKFATVSSALRAVEALDSRAFNGNAIKARFYSQDAFDQGQYE